MTSAPSGTRHRPSGRGSGTPAAHPHAGAASAAPGPTAAAAARGCSAAHPTRARARPRCAARSSRHRVRAMDLANRHVVVTGAAGGIGRALVRRFAAEGARAVVVADRDLDGARALAAEAGGPAVSLAEWLAIEYGDAGVRVSCICPQGVRTPMLELAMQEPASAAALTAGGLIEPEDVADAVMAGIREERLLILPHENVAGFLALKGSDPERWLRGMRRLVRDARAQSAGR